MNSFMMKFIVLVSFFPLLQYAVFVTFIGMLCGVAISEHVTEWVWRLSGMKTICIAKFWNNEKSSFLLLVRLKESLEQFFFFSMTDGNTTESILDGLFFVLYLCVFFRDAA